MKNITIESVNPTPYLDLTRVLKNPNSKCYCEDNMIHCIVDETDDEEYIAVVFNTAILLLMNYVKNSGLCKTEKQNSFVMSHLLHNPDFRYASVINLYAYLKNNNFIKESSYFLFNMAGLKDDIIYLLKTLKKQEAFEEEKKNARKSLTKHNKKLKDYKTLALVEDSQNGFALMADNGEKINVDTLESDFGISFKIDENMDIEQYVATFVALTCSILNTKELNIEPSFITILEDLLHSLSALHHEIDVNVFEYDEEE